MHCIMIYKPVVPSDQQMQPYMLSVIAYVASRLIRSFLLHSDEYEYSVDDHLSVCAFILPVKVEADVIYVIDC